MLSYFFNDLRVRLRLRIIFCALLFLVVIVFAVGQVYFGRVTSLFQDRYNSTTIKMENLIKISFHYNEVGDTLSNLRNAAMNTRSMHKQTLDKELQILKDAVADFVAATDPSDAESLRLCTRIVSLLEQYEAILQDRVIPSLEENRGFEVKELFDVELPKLRDDLMDTIAELAELEAYRVKETEKTLLDMIQMSTVSQTGILIVTVLFGYFMAHSVIKSIVRPMKQLNDAAAEMVKGNLNINLGETTEKDEFGDLSRNFTKMASIINGIVDAMNDMSKEHKAGDIDCFIDEKQFEGVFGRVAAGVNEMVSDHIQTKKKALYCVKEIVHGNFKADIEVLPGKKFFINQTINDLRASVTGINEEISKLVHATSGGDLSQRIDAKKYSGDWVLLMNGLNQFVDAVAKPVNEVSEIAYKMAKGDLSGKMNGSYKGDFLNLKNNMNSALGDVNKYVNEISATLVKLANKDFNQEVKGHYAGDFEPIKVALNGIITQLNGVMGSISSATVQIADGASHIADASAELAVGAEKQTNSLNQLTELTSSINEKTSESAESAKLAERLSDQSKANADVGSKEMNNMLKAMDNIKESSDNINKIIKVIEDIAFQTNLLALNAAVEAARAGVHGKGFAVVAEEVRNLASRSSTAAKETTALIDDSLSRVAEGTNIAVATSAALEKIVGNVSQVSGIITEIAKASGEQAKSIADVNARLQQISEVVQTTNATSEENAATAEEFTSQSQVLSSLLKEFILKG